MLLTITPPDTFHHLSEFAPGCTITHRTRGGVIVGTVIEVATDEHGVWLYVEYLAVNRERQAMHMTAWLNKDDVKWISGPKQTANAAIATSAAHL
jgi:hypothetical protein